MNKLFSIVVGLLLFLPLDVLAKPGGGGRSYSGGGRSGGGSVRPSIRPAATPKPNIAPKPLVSPKSVGRKSYSGRSPAPVKGVSGSKLPTLSPSVKPKTVSVDMKAVRDHGTVESRTAYKAALQKSAAPKPSYTNKNGKTINVNPSDKKVESIRNIDHDKWVNRESRVNKTYNIYHNRPTIFPATASYSDHYNMFFFMWLMDRSRDDQARWMYHHQGSMDPERYKYLTSKDSQLESRIKQLEKEKVQKDSNYVPKDIDPDLQYDDDFVDAVVNPEKVEDSEISGWGWFWIALILIVILGGVVLFVTCYEY